MSQLELIKQPRTLDEVDLDNELLLDLVLKHLYDNGVMNTTKLVERLGLAGGIVESLLDLLRNDFKVEVLAAADDNAQLRYKLTVFGQVEARNAYLRSGYSGRAPVSLTHYRALVDAQSVFENVVTKEYLDIVFSSVVLDEAVVNQLGPALNSGRPIMVYGPAGTGKTFICQHLAECLGDPVHLPYALVVGREIIQFFDPVLHIPVYTQTEKVDYQFINQTDQRLILCKRPIAISGGELTLESLELRYDAVTRFSQAPIQLKANNGIYIVDDMGRQRAPTIDLLNRWIVPMAEHVDYLTLGSGQHFPVPFNIILIFSTNINPYDLADAAFLRRLGYKIKFTSISKEAYKQLWGDICLSKSIQMEDGLLEQVFEWYENTKKPFFPCQPLDLLAIGQDFAKFNCKDYLSKTDMKLAWNTYFID